MKMVSTRRLHALNALARSYDYNQWVSEEFFTEVADPVGPHLCVYSTPHGLRQGSTHNTKRSRPRVIDTEGADLIVTPSHYRTAWWDVRAKYLAILDIPVALYRSLPEINGAPELPRRTDDGDLELPAFAVIVVGGEHRLVDGHILFEVVRQRGETQANVKAMNVDEGLESLEAMALDSFEGDEPRLPAAEVYEQKRSGRLTRRREERERTVERLTSVREQCSLCERKADKLWVSADDEIFCFRCLRPPVITLPPFVPEAVAVEAVLEAAVEVERKTGSGGGLAREARFGTRVRKLLVELEPHGIVGLGTPGGHVLLRRSDGVGGMVFASSSPSVRGWEKDVKRDLKRLGLLPR
jgi:hypothetical protein